MADKDAFPNPEEWNQRDAMLRFADSMVENTKLSKEHKLRFAERKMQDAEIWEKHQRLGHLHRIDGNQMASDLRAMAQRIQEQLG